jgi:hypothetical protein
MIYKLNKKNNMVTSNKSEVIQINTEVVNLTAIRLNCLILACQDEKPYRKVDLAKEYYQWVINEKVPNDALDIKPS